MKLTGLCFGEMPTRLRRMAALVGAAALCGAVMFLLPGCGGERLPYAREMGDMALMRTMGVDTGEGGAEQLHVTVSSGRRARGLQGEAEPPLVLSAERESISSACLAMQGLSDSYVFYGHVDQLLLGEELSRRGILETLQYFSQDQELGMGTQVWIVRGGTAAEAISAEQERGVESRLSTIQTDSEMGMAGMTRTVGETLTSLMEDGSAYLPGLVPGEDGALLEAGYGVVKDGMLAGWLTGEQARGLELAAEQVGADILELETRGGGAAVRVTAVSVSCVPEFSGERLTGLELACRLSLRAEESWGEPEPAELCAAAEERETARISAALEQLKGWNADCLGLARRAGQMESARWNALRAQWPEVFPELEIQVTVQASLLAA